MCLPCGPGHGAHTRTTQRGKLRPLTALLLLRHRGRLSDHLPTFIGKSIGSRRSTLGNTHSVVTRRIDRSRHTHGRLHGRFSQRTIVASGIIGNGRRRTTGCHSCFSFDRPLGHYSSRHLLTVHQKRSRNLLGMDVDPSSRRYTKQLRRVCIHNGGRYDHRMNRTIHSTCGQLLGPSVRARFSTLDGRGTSRRTVHIFTKGLERLLLTPPLKRGQIVKISPNCHAKYGVIYLSTRNSLLRGRAVCPRPPGGRCSRTTHDVIGLMRRCRVRTVTVNGNATDHRARRFVASRHCSHRLRMFMMDRSKTSVCSTSGATQSRFPRCSIAIHKTMSVNHQLVSPLTRLIGVSTGSVKIKRCRRSISRALLGGSLSRAIRDYIGLMNIGLGATDHRLLACVSKLNPTLTRGVISCHARGKPFDSHGRLLGMPEVKTGTFRRYTKFLHVPRTGGPLSGSTIRPRDCPVIRRVTGSLGYAMSRLVGDGRLHDQVSVGGCIAPAIKLPALASVVRRLSGPKHSPQRRVRIFRFSGGMGAVRSLARKVRLPNVIGGVAGFNYFMSVKVGRGNLIRMSRLTSGFIDSPAAMIDVRRRMQIGIVDVSLRHGHVRLAVGKLGRWLRRNGGRCKEECEGLQLIHFLWKSTTSERGRQGMRRAFQGETSRTYSNKGRCPRRQESEKARYRSFLHAYPNTQRQG